MSEVPINQPIPSSQTGHEVVLTDAPKETGFSGRIFNVLKSAKADLLEGNSRALKIFSGLGVLAMQGLDRARASVVFVPIVAVDVLKSTGSPTEAAIAAGATFGAWCAAVGAATAEGLNQFPNTVDAFEENFPAVVDVFQDSLPGLEAPVYEKEDSSARKLGRSALTHIKRGFTVTGIGTTAYVATSAVSGKDRKDVHKLNLNASIDGGAAISGVVLGVGSAIVNLANSDPRLAMTIENDASNPYLWYCIAGVMIAQQFITNRLKRRENNKKNILQGEAVQEKAIRLISHEDTEHMESALNLEQEVWMDKEYGSLKPYENYIDQSRIFAAYEGDRCIGVTRVFEGNPITPPFIGEMPFDDENVKKDLLELCKQGKIEEVGTTAVSKDAPAIDTAMGMWRMAYRDAVSRGVEHWGIIMEPIRVKAMCRRYGFTFKQVGPKIEYQGGMCAPHVLDFAEVDASMQATHPEYYDWFINQPL